MTQANAVGTTSYAYADWKTTITDPNGTPKDLYSDAFGNLNKVDEHNGGSTYTTQYAYDATAHLTNITDALSNIRAFTYDGLGRRLSAQDLHASGDSYFGTWYYAYDATSNLASTTDPKSQNVQYSYDDINRPLTENYTSQAGTEVTYAYDTGTDGVGRLSSATTASGATQYQYNSLGLTKSETKTISGSGFTTSYDYDRQGNQTLITYPDNAQVRNTYNTAGLLDKVEAKENGGSFVSVDSIDYGPHGKPVFKDYGNGTESIYTYDANELYRLKNIRTDHSGGMGGSLEDPTMVDRPRNENLYLQMGAFGKQLAYRFESKDAALARQRPPPG